MTDATLTLQLSNDLKNRLNAIAAATQSSASHLANEAIADYVHIQEAHIKGILKAQADIDAGLGIPHIEVMADAIRIIHARVQTDVKDQKKRM